MFNSFNFQYAFKWRSFESSSNKLCEEIWLILGLPSYPDENLLEYMAGMLEECNTDVVDDLIGFVVSTCSILTSAFSPNMLVGRKKPVFSLTMSGLTLHSMFFNGRKDLFHMTLDGSPQAPLSHEDEDAVLLKAPVIIAKVSISCWGVILSGCERVWKGNSGCVWSAVWKYDCQHELHDNNRDRKNRRGLTFITSNLIFSLPRWWQSAQSEKRKMPR